MHFPTWASCIETANITAHYCTTRYTWPITCKGSAVESVLLQLLCLAAVIIGTSIHINPGVSPGPSPLTTTINTQ
jgi:hypothetical protein